MDFLKVLSTLNDNNKFNFVAYRDTKIGSLDLVRNTHQCVKVFKNIMKFKKLL